MNRALRSEVAGGSTGVASVSVARTSRSTAGGILKQALRHPHYMITLALAIALVPALAWTHLPLQFEWRRLLLAYWVSLAFQAIFAATLFCMIGLPGEVTWRPLVQRYMRDKRRILLLLPFLLLLGVLFARLASLWMVPIVIVVAITLLEFFERTLTETQSLKQKVLTLLMPALYLFVGLLLVFAYNDIAVTTRPFVAYDSLLDRADSVLFGGASPATTAHRLMLSFPPWADTFTETIYYYCMFPQIGGALILIALRRGTVQALHFVGAVLLTYYVALGVFWAWPTMGPFFLGQPGAVRTSVGPLTSEFQTRVIAQIQSLWAGRGLPSIGLDYYIAFPSLHIALPMLTAWFLRPWRRLVYSLLAFQLLLVAAIYLLEWHYVVDLLGGALIAGTVIAISLRFSDIDRASAFSEPPSG
jgi:hypothetical protein